jgi:hypothetical protein
MGARIPLPDGRKVSVSNEYADRWDAMAPDQRRAEYPALMSQADQVGIQPDGKDEPAGGPLINDNPRAVTAGPGVLKSIATGLRNTGEAIVGGPGDMVNLDASLATKLAKYLEAGPETLAKIEEYRKYYSGEGAGSSGPSTLTTPEVRGHTDTAVKALPETIAKPVQDITRHQPEDRLERWAQTGGELAPALLSPGTLPIKVGGWALSTAATEGSGEIAEAAGASPEVANAVRTIVGALTTAGAAKVGGHLALKAEVGKVVKAGPEAVKAVFANLTDQFMTPADAVAKMQAMGFGDIKPMLLQTGPNTAQEAQRIQAAGGPGRGIIDPKVKAQDAQINPALEKEVTAAVGPEQPASVTEQALKTRLTDAQQAQKDAHAAQVQPVDLKGMGTDLATELSAAKGAKERRVLTTIRGLLDQPTEGAGPAALETGSQPVLKIRQAIRDLLYEPDGKTVKSTLSPGEAEILKRYYSRTNEALDPANPTLRAADADIHQVGKEEKAFVEGQKVYENKPAHEGGLHPTDFKAAYDAMTPGEQARVLDGLNVETWRQLGVKGNDLVTLKGILKGDGKWNHQKVAAVIGDDAANRLMNALSNASELRAANDKIIKGSKTVETGRPANDKSGLRKLGDAAVESGSAAWAGGPWAGGAVALSHLKRFLAEQRSAGALDPKMDAEVARVLTLDDPSQVAALSQILAKKPGTLLKGGPAVAAALLARQQDVSERKNRQR